MTWARNSSQEDELGWSEQARAAERERREVEAGKAALTVAGHATNVAECRELLDMLGLEPTGAWHS